MRVGSVGCRAGTDFSPTSWKQVVRGDMRTSSIFLSLCESLLDQSSPIDNRSCPWSTVSYKRHQVSDGRRDRQRKRVDTHVDRYIDAVEAALYHREGR